MRQVYIAGNWKMHKTVPESTELAKNLVSAVKDETKKIMIAPPFTALSAVKECVRGSNIFLGAQNMGPVEQGAHTGEISAGMLKDIEVDVVILGHSERRHVYHEEDELINGKVLLALVHDLSVILCVGETLEQREGGLAKQIVEQQLTKGLKDVNQDKINGVTIAYEPVWAIGTGKTATPQDADKIHAAIREVLAALYTAQDAEKMVIQYGGSVKPDNAAELMTMENIDGVLVGGASLSADSFTQIIKYDL